jgi:hypothetical protein
MRGTMLGFFGGSGAPAICLEPNPVRFPAMTKSTGKNRPVMHKVDERHISPDDIRARLIEVEARELADTRTDEGRTLVG